MKSAKSGFSFVEIIIAIGLAAIFLPALSQVLSLSIRSASQGEKYSQAQALAQEGMEAIFYLKSLNDAKWNWTTTPSNTPTGYFYQPTKSGSTWTLGSMTNTPTVTVEPFIRKIEISEVKRCGTLPNPVICSDPLAAVDPYTRLVSVVVSWPEDGSPQKITMNAYVTAH